MEEDGEAGGKFLLPCPSDSRAWNKMRCVSGMCLSACVCIRVSKRNRECDEKGRACAEK